MVRRPLELERLFEPARPRVDLVRVLALRANRLLELSNASPGDPTFRPFEPSRFLRQIDGVRVRTRVTEGRIERRAVDARTRAWRRAALRRDRRRAWRIRHGSTRDPRRGVTMGTRRIAGGSLLFFERTVGGGDGVGRHGSPRGRESGVVRGRLSGRALSSGFTPPATTARRRAPRIAQALPGPDRWFTVSETERRPPISRFDRTRVARPCAMTRTSHRRLWAHRRAPTLRAPPGAQGTST